MAQPAIQKSYYKQKRARHGRFKPSVLFGLNNAIAGKVARLTNETLEEITRPKDKYKLREYKQMLASSPEAAACINLKGLRAAASLGEYSHEEKDAQKQVRENLEGMRGSIKDFTRQASSSAMSLGLGLGEIVWTNRAPGHRFEWRLDTINILDPERCHFAGKKGDIKYVIYNDPKKGKKWIEYSRVIHVVSGMHLGDPFGDPEARRAMPLFKAMQLILSEMVVAGKNSASGLLVAQADSNERVRVLGSDGKPYKNPDGTEKTMTGPEALLHQMKGIESSGIVATDLKNKITPLVIPNDAGYWNTAWSLLRKGLFLSFMVPSLIWDEGSSGLGNSGISGNHLAVLDANIDAVVQQIQDQLVEKVARNIIQWNLGWKKGWGQFEKQPYTDPTAQMSRVSNLVSAMSMQIIPNTDIDAINRLREDLGISPITQEDMLAMQQMQAAMQQMMAPADPAMAGAQPQQGY